MKAAMPHPLLACVAHALKLKKPSLLGLTQQLPLLDRSHFVRCKTTIARKKPRDVFLTWTTGDRGCVNRTVAIRCSFTPRVWYRVHRGQGFGLHRTFALRQGGPCATL